MKRLVALLLLGSSLNAMVITKDEGLVAQQQSGALELLKTKKNYKVITEHGAQKVKPYNVDPALRKLDNNDLKKFLKSGGYIEALQAGEGYKLRAQKRLKGGGPFLAWTFYGLTKGALYATAAVAVASSLFVTQKAVSNIVGNGVSTGIHAKVGYEVVKNIGETEVGTVLAGPEAVVISAMIGSNKHTTRVAVELTGATLAASGGCLATMGTWIESAAVSAYFAGLAIPWW